MVLGNLLSRLVILPLLRQDIGNGDLLFFVATQIATASTLLLFNKVGRLNREKELALAQLQEYIESVKILSGIIPICMYCRKIRDDDEWVELEEYVTHDRKVDMSHGVCPTCFGYKMKDLRKTEQ